MTLATLVGASVRSEVGRWMEIITGVERRRRWRVEDKLRIVAEAEAPGAIISHVARRHHVSRGLLSSLRQQIWRGALAVENHVPVLKPVQMPSEPRPPVPSASALQAQGAGTRAVTGDRRIEIALPDGTCIRVGADVGGPRPARRGPHRHAPRHERPGTPGAAGVAARSACGRPLHVPGVSVRARGGNWMSAAGEVGPAGWHISQHLAVPENIAIVPLSAKCPELNPVENVWQFMRNNWLSNRVFASYNAIDDHCCSAWNKLADQPWRVMSIGLRDWAKGKKSCFLVLVHRPAIRPRNENSSAGSILIRAQFDAARSIGLRLDADENSRIVQQRQAADVAIQHQPNGRRQRRPGFDHRHVIGHDVAGR